MLWLNASRERIKSENPGISVTEISKKAGEMWRQLGKEEKEVRQRNDYRFQTLRSVSAFILVILWDQKTVGHLIVRLYRIFLILV